MDTAPPQSAPLLLRLIAAEADQEAAGLRGTEATILPASLARELWVAAEAELCGLTVADFATALTLVARRYHCGQPAGAVPSQTELANFVSGLRLSDLALATGCALGREEAWQRFLTLYRARLTQAAIAITGSASLGHDLADSLYAELYGLQVRHDPGQEVEVRRRSPLASYSGRGSLLGWLRTTLAQRHVDHHRRSRRITSFDALQPIDAPAPERIPLPLAAEVGRLGEAVERTLRTLAAEDRFVLSAYFLDRQTLLQIARILQVHEATISRRIKRLTGDLRAHLLLELQASGMSKRAAEEALGTDPRDIEINLRSLLQTSHGPAFPDKREEECDAPENPSSSDKKFTG